MYRSYENTNALETLLNDAKSRYDDAVQRGEDTDTLYHLNEDIEDLKERLNFAYEDDNY